MKKNLEKATFAAGCFWHVEEAFRELKGVLKTTVGYTGGSMKNPSYEKVCTGATGHAEVVEIVYDLQQISYEELLDIFWKNHNPTTPNRQGPDVGSQYRSAIFYHNKKQKKAAEISLTEQQKKWKTMIVTEIVPAMMLYNAEEYHQQYLKKRGLKTCSF